MSNDIVMFDANGPSNLPAHLQGTSLAASAGLLATVGASGNRIGLKGSRFRVVMAGNEEAVRDENYLDVIVVGAVPAVSRVFYAGVYDPNTKAAPDCYSADGIAPPDDVKHKQSDKCATCPQNVKGSKVVGTMKVKACAYFQRLIVRIVGDESRTLFKLDVKALGLFGDSDKSTNKYNLKDYTMFLQNRKTDVAQLVTRLSFDVDQSVPKLMFHPSRYITAEEFADIKEVVGSPEVEKMLEINMTTVDLSEETSSDEAAPAPSQKPVAPTETVKPADAEKAAAAQARAAQAKEEAQAQAAAASVPAAAEPKKHYRKTEKVGNFDLRKDFLDQGWTVEALIAEGYMVEVEPPAPPAAPKPPAPPVAPKPPAPPKPPAAPQTAPVVEDVPMPNAAPKPPAAPAARPAPAAQAAPVQETSTDAEIMDIIGELT